MNRPSGHYPNGNGRHLFDGEDRDAWRAESELEPGSIEPDEMATSVGLAPTPLPELRTICPTSWEGVAVPPREWLVTSWLPKGTVTLLSGDGATGKSTIALQLSAALAVGRDCLGDKHTPRTLDLFERRG
jgi:hypothetical protein